MITFPDKIIRSKEPEACSTREALLARTTFRILCIASAIGLSHMTRLLLIAGELRKEKQHIGFAYGGKHSELLSTLGYEWFPVEDVQITDFDKNVFARFPESLIARCVQDQLRIIAKFKPDALITDFQPTTSIAAYIAGVPRISVLNGYLTDCFDATALFMHPEKHPFKHRLTDWFVRKILAVQKRALATPFRRVARKFGVRNKSTLHDFLEGDFNLIADLPEFCPLKGLPDTYNFIGPLIWEGSDGESFAVPLRRPSGQKVIYATIGNTGKPELLDMVIATFAGVELFQVVMTTGAYIAPDRYLQRPNISVRKFIPGSLIMKQSDLVIHCGGNGTTYQCLANGVPAIVVPYNNDQKINAQLIQKQGVGIAFSPEKLDHFRLLAAVHHVLANDAYRSRVRQFQQILGHTNGPKNAAEAILAFVGERCSASRGGLS